MGKYFTTSILLEEAFSIHVASWGHNVKLCFCDILFHSERCNKSTMARLVYRFLYEKIYKYHCEEFIIYKKKTMNKTDPDTNLTSNFKDQQIKL